MLSLILKTTIICFSAFHYEILILVAIRVYILIARKDRFLISLCPYLCVLNRLITWTFGIEFLPLGPTPSHEDVSVKRVPHCTACTLLDMNAGHFGEKEWTNATSS
jgi:hypothetical protein